MTELDWTEAPIDKAHDRTAFDCGDADLNLCLQRYARRNHDSGGALLPRAVDRCLRVAQDVGRGALLIDAKNDRAAGWYGSYGALRLDDAPLSLVLPLAVAADAFRRGIESK